MEDTIFREYDIRGIVGSEFQLEQVYQLGCALAYYFINQNTPVRSVAVGRDGRVHSAYIHAELVRALIDSGLHVISVGLCPTPVLYFSMHTLPIEAGVMITASHNGKEHNGIKICLSKDAVWGIQIGAIKEIYGSKKIQKSLLKGTYTEYPMVERYTDWIINQFQHLKNSAFPIVFDCGNGAAGVVVPQLIEKMGWQNALVLYESIDGDFPNHAPDPGLPENCTVLRKTVLERALPIGIAFDGDADRMIAISKDGLIIPGDKLLAVYAHDIAKAYPGATIIYDIKCSSYLAELLINWGAKPCLSPSGHSIIKHELKKQQALLAGELSCHFYFNDRYFGYDDGIYAAMRLYELLAAQKDITEILALFPPSFSTPEIRIACSSEIKHQLLASVNQHFLRVVDARISRIDGIRVSMPYGWGLVRFSNTQAVLSLRFEADTVRQLRQIKEDFYTSLVPYINERVLWNALFD